MPLTTVYTLMTRMTRWARHIAMIWMYALVARLWRYAQGYFVFLPVLAALVHRTTRSDGGVYGVASQRS